MKKKANIIYPVVLVCVVVVILVLSTKMEKMENDDKNTLGSNETGSNIVGEEKKTYSKAEQDIINEATKIISGGGSNKSLKGQYKDRPHSISVNPESITDELVFFDPIRLISYEFISYEELDDLSHYDTSIDSNDYAKCFDYGFTSAYSTYTKYRKVINEDGSLNAIVNVTKERLLDGVYGDIVKEDKNHEYKPVKITLRISNNTQVSQEIIVFDNWGIGVQKLITMDDGKLYLYESIYNETLSIVGEPIYCSAENRYKAFSSGIPQYIRINGNESIEVSYIFMLDDSGDLTYIVMGIPEEVLTSYYASFVRYFPIGNIKKLEVVGR